jgi:hypothetical protein
MERMWIVTTVCSDDACAAEAELVVDSLEEIEALACECGHCLVSLAIASFEPAYAAPRLRLVQGSAAPATAKIAA